MVSDKAWKAYLQRQKENEKVRLDEIEKAIYTIEERDTSKKPKKTNIKIDKGFVFNIETFGYRDIAPNEAKARDLPIFARPTKMLKNSSYRGAVIIDRHKRLRKVKENIKNCNYETLTDLCDLSGLIHIHSQHLYNDSSFGLLEKDVIHDQKEFIENCKLPTKTAKK